MLQGALSRSLQGSLEGSLQCSLEGALQGALSRSLQGDLSRPRREVPKWSSPWGDLGLKELFAVKEKVNPIWGSRVYFHKEINYVHKKIKKQEDPRINLENTFEGEVDRRASPLGIFG